MARVLITGGRAPVALDLARQFAGAGSQVFVADSTPCFLARSSRSVTRAFRVPRPRASPRAFAEAIEAIVVAERIERIVPTCEEVFYLSRYAERLRRRTELFCPDLDRLRELHSKWRFSQLAQGLGVEVPDTWILSAPGEIASLPRLPEELVFKPVYSRFAVHTLVRPDRAALENLHPTAERPWVAQRFIEGRELCSYSVARDGTLAAHALYAPAWRAGRGSGYYFLPAAVPAVEEFARRFVAAVGYTGQIAFDFIEAPDGRIYVLECNPRATSGVHLFRQSDGLAAAFDGTSPRLVRPSGDPGMLAMAMAFLGAPEAVRSGRAREWLRDFRRGHDALWSWRDPAPAFYVFAGLAAWLAIAWRDGITPQAASTCDIEWDGEAIA